ncbi:MAG: TIGR03936 family radical SAM-associated protein, partial [Oscillospiraceae bacterium]
PKTVRVVFEKSGRAVYISHLDLNRAMSRALARSGLPVWYTQGFHPHLYLTFALPLSLGVIGRCETMDFRLISSIDPEELVARLDAALPQGLRAISAGEPVMEPKRIMWADYRVELRCDPAQGREAVAAFSALPAVMAEKRGKKGIQTLDIRPMFSVPGISETENGLTVLLRCRAGVEINLNPSLVLGALTAQTGLAVAQSKIARTAIKTETLEDFC